MDLNKIQSAPQFRGPISAEELRSALTWPPGGTGRLAVRLAAGLRDLIRTGGLASDTGLPPSRQVAVALGVSRGVVVAAYDQLVSEGYLEARQGAGTWVGRAVETPPALPLPSPVPLARPGLPDLSDFPRGRWLTAYRHALSTMAPAELGYGDPRGHVELRTELAGQLRRTRGVDVEPDGVLVVNGVAEGLALLADVLLTSGRPRVVVEDPTSPGAADLLSRRGLEVQPVPVDEDGLDVSRLQRSARLGAVFLTPAHQYPTGVVLTPGRRLALIDLARQHNLVLIEDDYDGSFRFDREPVGCLQGLAPDVTVLLGSVSKTLAPALRLGWLIAPRALQGRLIERRKITSLVGQTVDQLTLAQLLRSGHYDKHVRQMRRNYSDRRRQLVEELYSRAPSVTVGGDNSGLHLLAQVPSTAQEKMLLSILRAEGYSVQGVSECRLGDGGGDDLNGLVIGFASMKPAALVRLAALVGQACA